MPRMRWCQGSAPDPDGAGGAHDTPPNPLVGWEGNTPSQETHSLGASLGAFGASLLGSSILFLAIHHWE